MNLQQPYFQCHDSTIMAIESVVGSAIGVANTIATGAMLLLGYLLVMVYNRHAHKSNVEKLKNMKKHRNAKTTFKAIVVPEINKIKVTSPAMPAFSQHTHQLMLYILCTQVDRILTDLTKDSDLFLRKAVITCLTTQAKKIAKLEKIVENYETKISRLSSSQVCCY